MLKEADRHAWTSGEVIHWFISPALACPLTWGTTELHWQPHLASHSSLPSLLSGMAMRQLHPRESLLPPLATFSPGHYATLGCQKKKKNPAKRQPRSSLPSTTPPLIQQPLQSINHLNPSCRQPATQTPSQALSLSKTQCPLFSLCWLPVSIYCPLFCLFPQAIYPGAMMLRPSRDKGSANLNPVVKNETHESPPGEPSGPSRSVTNNRARNSVAGWLGHQSQCDFLVAVLAESHASTASSITLGACRVERHLVSSSGHNSSESPYPLTLKVFVSPVRPQDLSFSISQPAQYIFSMLLAHTNNGQA